MLTRALTLLLVLFVAAGPAGASTVGQTLNFTSQMNQSQFGNPAFSFTDERFLGTSWNDSVNHTIPGTTIFNSFCLGVQTSAGCAGVTVPRLGTPDIAVAGGTNGNAGLASSFMFDDGSLAVDLPVNAAIDNVPDLPTTPGSVVTLNSSASIDPTAGFNTMAPGLDYNFGFVFDFGGFASVAGEGPTINFSSAAAAGVIGYPSFTVPNPQGGTVDAVTLFGLNAAGNALDPTVPPGVPTPLELITSTPAIQDPLLKVPDVQVIDAFDDSVLMGTDSDIFASITFDMDGLATLLLGLPPLEDDFSLLDFIGIPSVISDNAGAIASALGLNPAIFGDLDLTYDYNLADLDWILDTALRQSFQIDQFDLDGTILLEDGTIIPFTPGEDIDITIPSGVGNLLDVDVLLDVTAMVQNDTDITFSLSCALTFLGFSLDLPLGLPGVNIGPETPACATFGLGDVDVFDSQFAIDLGQQQFSFQIAVPEPSTWLLLALGAGGLLGMRRRGRRRTA